MQTVDDLIEELQRLTPAQRKQLVVLRLRSSLDSAQDDIAVRTDRNEIVLEQDLKYADGFEVLARDAPAMCPTCGVEHPVHYFLA